MPIGILVNAMSVAVGGMLGALLQGKLKERMQADLNLIFGLCSVGMGISATVQMQNMPAVVFALILGGLVGLICHLGDRISAGAEIIQQKFRRGSQDGETTALFVTVLVLFCASGTGIYGALLSGFNGDQSVLLAKSILDLFTAAIFACTLGAVVSLTAIPQCALFLLLFGLAKLILPLTTPAMIADFKACGGMIMVATGLRIAQIRSFPIADLLPAMVLVMPLSRLWSFL